MKKNSRKAKRTFEPRTGALARTRSLRALNKTESHRDKRADRNSMSRGPTKTFQQDGHWVVKIKKTPIYVCECGNKYLKTRPHQTRCLRCLAYVVIDRR